jgi:hypothetical protein
VVAAAHATKTAVDGDATVPEGLSGVRSMYHRMLGDQEPSLELALRGAAGFPVAVSEGAAYEALCDAFKRSIMDEHADYEAFSMAIARPAGHVREQHDRVRAALDGMAPVWPEFDTLYRMLVPVLLFAPDGGLAGGTTNAVLGTLWLDPKPDWSRIDIGEFLVHEFTHTTLYLEERRFGFYWDLPKLSREEFLTPSVIRQDLRPLDKVFHSIVVAMEVVFARERLGTRPAGDGLHPDTPTLLANTRTSLEAVFRLPLEELVRPRPIEILELCRARVADIRPV